MLKRQRSQLKKKCVSYVCIDTYFIHCWYTVDIFCSTKMVFFTAIVVLSCIKSFPDLQNPFSKNIHAYPQFHFHPFNFTCCAVSYINIMLVMISCEDKNIFCLFGICTIRFALYDDDNKFHNTILYWLFLVLQVRKLYTWQHIRWIDSMNEMKGFLKIRQVK